jgi:NADH dehydrogenase [ubiquinone] 1 alpha subcomplex assembly factor 1
MQDKINKMGKETMVEDFNSTNHLNWEVINDGVMGGISESNFQIQTDQTAVFSGRVSLQNNGGFASVRASFGESVSGNFEKIVIRVKGDGKTYSLRIRTDQNFDGVAYACSFSTIKDEWTMHEFSPVEFVPTFRGRTLSNVPPLNNLNISHVGFLISEKQSGSFGLIINWIKITRL